MLGASRYMMAFLMAGIFLLGGLFAPVADACCGRLGRFGFAGVRARVQQRQEARASGRVGFFRARAGGCSSGSCSDASAYENGCVGGACGQAEVQAQPPAQATSRNLRPRLDNPNMKIEEVQSVVHTKAVGY
jgi:hypothetical protein